MGYSRSVQTMALFWALASYIGRECWPSLFGVANIRPRTIRSVLWAGLIQPHRTRALACPSVRLEAPGSALGACSSSPHAGWSPDRRRAAWSSMGVVGARGDALAAMADTSTFPHLSSFSGSSHLRFLRRSPSTRSYGPSYQGPVRPCESSPTFLARRSAYRRGVPQSCGGR